MLGQTVATQQIGKGTNGQAVFNTSMLASGVYIYAVETENGNRTTGRVSINH
jgi:hypothetical protein